MAETEEVPAWYCDFKLHQSLVGSIHPVVWLLGLNPKDSLVHRGIWEILNMKNVLRDNISFNDRQSMLFSYFLYGSIKEAPVPLKKYKKEVTDSYVPNGILSSAWINKHTEKIPSVAIVFFEMNWNDSHWNERKTECAQLIKSTRDALSPHGTQVLVMLIKAAGAPEDNFSTDRANALCAAADILPKCLYRLSHTHNERIQTCVQRLENGIKDATKTYYTNRVKKIKHCKEKVSHSYMLIRYNFKIAFFEEIKKDVITSLSHYTAAYDSLLSARITDANVQEIRVLGSIITYRTCRLHLIKRELNEAKKKFSHHIQTFSDILPNRDLYFELLAWLEQEYHHFAELLRQFYRSSTMPPPSPATYYLSAYRYGKIRRNYCLNNVLRQGPYQISAAFQSLLSGNINLKYLGERPWKHGSFLPDGSKIEPSAIVTGLKYLESKVSHEKVIINHLGIGFQYCVEDNHNRMKCEMMCYLGTEYFFAKDYSKTIMLMNNALGKFGEESWTKVICWISETGLRAAYCEGDVAAYISFLIVLLSPIFLSEEFITKERQMSLWSKFRAVMDGRIPLSEDGYLPNSENWERKLKEPFVALVDVHKNCVVKCKISFQSSSVKASSPVIVRFDITNFNHFSVQLRKCGVEMNKSDYNKEIDVDLLIEPNKTKQVEISIKPLLKDVSKHIRVQMGYIDIGKPNGSVKIHYSCKQPSNSFLESRIEKTPPLSVRIEPVNLMLTPKIIRHDCILLNEWYKFVVKWTNEDSCDYRSLNISCAINVLSPECASLMVDPASGKLGDLSITKELDVLKSHDCVELPLYIRTINISEKEIRLETKVKCLDGNNFFLSTEHVEMIEVVVPFNVSQCLTTVQGQKVDSVSTCESFWVDTEIQNSSKVSILVRQCDLVLHDSLFLFESNEKQIEDVTLGESEAASMSLYMKYVEGANLKEIPAGTMKIIWKRLNEEHTTTTEVSLMTVKRKDTALMVTSNFSDNHQGKLKKPLYATYTIYNDGPDLIDLTVSMKSSETFMIAGPKKHVNVRFNSKQVIGFSYVLFPLYTGLVETPKISITQMGEAVSSVSDDVPKYIFVTNNCDAPGFFNCYKSHLKDWDYLNSR